MSFKSEAAKVKSGIASGSYKKKTDVFSGFFDELSYGIKKADEVKRQEKLEEQRETREENRRIAAKQKTKEAEDIKNNKLVSLYLTSNDIDKTPENRSLVLQAVTDGGFSTFSGLNDYMTQYSSYSSSSATPLADVSSGETVSSATTEALAPSTSVRPTKRPKSIEDNYVSNLDSGAAPLETADVEIDDIAAQMGKITMGKQVEKFDVSTLTENNWVGYLQTFEGGGEGQQENVDRIKAVVAENSWDQKINGISRSDMAGKSSGWYADFLRGVDPKDTEAVKYINDGLAAAKVREAEPDFWKDPVKMATYDSATLGTFLATKKYAVKSEAYNTIDSYLKIKLVIEGNADVESLAGASSQKIKQFLTAAQGTLSTQNLSALTNMVSIAEEYEKNGAESATAKQIAMKAFIGIEMRKDISPQEKIQKMAQFEKSWAKATSLVQDTPEFWQKPEVLSKLSTVEMNTMLTSGLLGSETEAGYLAVKAAYEGKLAIETGNLDSLVNMNSTEMSKWFVTNADFLAKPENSELLADYQEMKSLQIEKEKGSENPQLLTTKQIALRDFLKTDPLKNMSAEDVQKTMAQWEKDWDSAVSSVAEKDETYTQSNYAADVIRYQTMLKTGTDDEKLKATKWFELEQPIIKATLQEIKNLDTTAEIALLMESGIDQETARGIATGTLKLNKNAFGFVEIVDLSTGTTTDVKPADANAPISGTEVSLTEAKEAMEALGLGTNIENLNDISAAFGAESYGGVLVNKLAGIFNGQPASDVGPAVAALEALNTITTLQMVTMFPNIRDSVALKTELKKILAPPGKFIFGKKSALDKFKSALGVLNTAINTNTQIKNARDVDGTTRSKSSAALLALGPLAEVYKLIVTDLTARLDPENSVVGSDSSLFKKPPTPVTITSKDDPAYVTLPDGAEYFMDGKKYKKGQ